MDFHLQFVRVTSSFVEVYGPIDIHNITSEQLRSLIALQFATSSEGFSKQGPGKFAMVWSAFLLPLYFD